MYKTLEELVPLQVNVQAVASREVSEIEIRGPMQAGKKHACGSKNPYVIQAGRCRRRLESAPRLSVQYVSIVSCTTSYLSIELTVLDRRCGEIIR